MKHILNDLTEQEKNSIREQHTGGMKVMTESFSKLLNSKLGDVKPMVSEQVSNNSVDLKKVVTILNSLGFKNSPTQGYKLRMEKPNDGPIKDKSGNYVASYEAYIPSKQDSSGHGFTDGKTLQLWIDKRSGLKPGLDEPNSYNQIYDLNPEGITLQIAKNGKVVDTEKLSIEDFYTSLQSYK